ncbi:MAG: TIGR03960 family B12-binding radical SAM protein [Firmicutes bacterium]|nr:TIGR03960 family B12-binding radical SAM protein [Bacillota bacterium]
MDISSLLNKVRKPARYIGREINSVYKRVGDIKVHLALAFPDLYEVGMSHLGLKILYALVNERPEFYAERVFAPAEDMEALLKESGSFLFSLESRTPLKNFDMVGFTLQYELSYTTILHMLALGGLPLHSNKRKDGDPFVIGGGPCSLNPEPLAAFFDFFVIGDGEEILPELLHEFACWKNGSVNGGNRKEFLRKMARIPGIYVPSFYEPLYRQGKFRGMKILEKEAPLKIKRRTVADLNEAFYPRSFVVPYADAVHDRASLELFRGCTQGCRFCQAGYIYRPVRERTVSKLTDLAEDIISATGFEELSLSSLSSSDYSAMEMLLEKLEQKFAKKHVKLSLPSLRADPLAMQLADRVNQSGGVTFAPEAGSQRLRDVINKNITEEEILAAAAHVISAGRRRIKLYFMLGLPTETEEDLQELVWLVQKIVDLRRTVTGRKRSFKVTVSVSTFVPKAHTPFQWEPQLPLAEIKLRQEFLRKHLRKIKGVDFTWHEAEMSLLEAVFARGDRRLSSVLEKAYLLGSRFDAWNDKFDYSLWEEAFAAARIEPESYAGSAPDPGEPLPWEHIDTGISKKFWQKEHAKALKGEVTLDCRKIGCVGCGLEGCPSGKVKKGVSL